MTKAELIDAIMKSEEMPPEMTKKTLTALFELTFDQIKTAVKEDGKVSVPGFGTFTRKDRAAREGRNPQTGETIQIKASKTMSFKPSKDVKEFLN